MAWAEHQRAYSRAEYARLYKSPKPPEITRHVVVPDDVERFDYVPEPCFNCGTRRGCKHRPWMLAL